MENKKNEDKRIERRIPLHFLIGLNAALLLTLAAFEWTPEVEPVDIDFIPTTRIDIDEPPIIKAKVVPPKPKPTTSQVNEVEDDAKELEDPLEVTVDDIPASEPFELGDIDFEAVEIPVENSDEIFFPFEAQPDFQDGMEQFYAFLAKNVRYPAAEKRMGVEGKVHVSFIVERDGSLSNIEIVKGLSSGCDAEAIRVMKMVTGFIPGEQRGTPVRVKMTVPIFYKLK